MGGANGKTLSPNINQAYDVHDPRSPSLKRTPLNTPEDWRQKAARMNAMKEDPRSPGLERTPVVDSNPVTNIAEPVTPLTLSYEDCRKIAPDDPRSPLSFRTPLNYTQGIAQYDTTNVVTCPSFTDDTVIVTDSREPETNELDVTISVSSSGQISSPLMGMSIVSKSAEVEAIKEKEEEESDGRKQLVQSELDIEVPSSPLGASAYKIEKEEPEKKSKAAAGYVGSPALDRKRKAKQLPGVSPLKKSYSSPSMSENDENFENSPSVVPIKSASPALARKAPGTPTSRRSPQHKRTPSNGASRRSSNLKNNGTTSPRSPLSPLVARPQRMVDVTPILL